MRREDGAGHRHARLEFLIRDELRSLLSDDISDPALADVRVSAVVLSVDYRHARVHFALHRDEGDAERERRRAELALLRATPFLRRRLAEAIECKRIPDLRFVFDGISPLDAEEGPCSA